MTCGLGHTRGLSHAVRERMRVVFVDKEKSLLSMELAKNSCKRHFLEGSGSYEGEDGRHEA